MERSAAELQEARSEHLRRVAWWGGLNLAGGLALAGMSEGAARAGRRGFGLQSAVWGAINLGIVGAATLAGTPEPAGTLAGALAAEERWGQILLVNLGLNVGYVMVGTALAVAAGRGLRRGDVVRGHALAVILQGAGLFVLDGVAFLESHQRMEALREVVESVAIHPGSEGGVDLAVSIPLP